MDDKMDSLTGRTRDAEDDVEGHSLSRDAEGAITSRGGLDEGYSSRRNAIPDDGDDVEGHSLSRGGEGITARFSDDAPGGEGLTGRVGPGEGNTSRT